MHIWVDADACPSAIKEILYRAAERAQLPMTLVANKALTVPRSSWIRSLQVMRGFDVADNEIAKRVAPGDLVITADIPLASDVVARGGHAINPRGELYTPENIRERLATRDFLEKLRETGVQTGGPAPLDNTDRKRFADQLDRLLTRFKNSQAPA
ncbi:MAG TPA: YaiI/YqxD family protein [Burkholderiales bacterium]|nr:YaiI/YqxD family protein [Burkholderiales bacterium]